MFASSTPATADGFFDRDVELARVEDALSKLVKGAPKWLCLLGPRKVGKTSLLREVERRLRQTRRHRPRFIVVDVFETLPVSTEVFRQVAVEAVEVLLARDAGRSISAALPDARAWQAALLASPRFRALPAPLQLQVFNLAVDAPEGQALHAMLELPERLAVALGAHLVIALDEFQELAQLTRGSGADLMALLRSVWQRHQRTTYVVSGSARTTLLELTSSSRSPFFQHFEVLEVHPFDEPHAVELLTRLSADAPHRISAALARRAFAAVGGSPFYLQVLGEALCDEAGRDEKRLREALQRVLFSTTGRLSLYFQNEFQRLVGRATTLAATLNALADGPLTLSQVARAIDGVAAATAGYLGRLGDAVERGDEARWQLADPTFALWLQWRKPGGTVVPMKVVGDDAELATARRLAELGFELVYQSRGSRGAFDLLATRGARVLAVQVKRSPLPLRFTRAAWQRMEADAKRYGWQWLIAQVAPDGLVQLLDPAKAARRDGVTLGPRAVIDHPLDWLERGP
jgi:AAA+ ATPase superfamily predicted ATPase